MMTADDTQKIDEDPLPPINSEHARAARALIDNQIARGSKEQCCGVWMLIRDLPEGISDRTLAAVEDSLRGDGFRVEWARIQSVKIPAIYVAW